MPLRMIILPRFVYKIKYFLAEDIVYQLNKINILFNRERLVSGKIITLK